MRILSVFYSLSGNTEKTIRVANEHFKELGHKVDVYYIDPWHKPHQIPQIDAYDLAVIGTYTEDFGRVPEEVKTFVAHNRVVSTPVAVLGTGDTFWGEENYCGAVDRLAKFYNSPFTTLKAEHYPSNQTQKDQICNWASIICEEMAETESYRVLRTLKKFSPEFQVQARDFVI